MAKRIEKLNNGSKFSPKGYNKTESWDAETIDELASHYHSILKLLGEDPDREGLIKTPERVAKAMHFLTMGYSMNACQILNSAKFKEDYKQMVLVKDIDLYSMCEHHLLPFFGRCHIGYIPNAKIIGDHRGRIPGHHGNGQDRARIPDHWTGGEEGHDRGEGVACRPFLKPTCSASAPTTPGTARRRSRP